MSFTLQTDPLDWAIHGQYGGEFVAKVSNALVSQEQPADLFLLYV